MVLVVEKYGGTTWIEHQDYFLRGRKSTETVVADSATSTGGSDKAYLVKHQHGLSNFGNISVPSGTFNGTWSPNGQRAFTDFAGETDGTGKNIPVYKAVYIWERTA